MHTQAQLKAKSQNHNTMENFNWTPKKKQQACEAILSDYNNYEVKPVKFLKGVQFYPDGTARKVGKAHDYTFQF